MPKFSAPGSGHKVQGFAMQKVPIYSKKTLKTTFPKKKSLHEWAIGTSQKIHVSEKKPKYLKHI